MLDTAHEHPFRHRTYTDGIDHCRRHARAIHQLTTEFFGVFPKSRRPVRWESSNRVRWRSTAPATQRQGAWAMADIPEEHLTEELLDRLLASASIEQYLDEGLVSARTLTDYLFDRMEAHDLRRADVVRASGLNATVVYDIFSGKSRPGRDHAIMLAFGLKCTLRETQRLLRLAGVSELWCKQRRDYHLVYTQWIRPHCHGRRVVSYGRGDVATGRLTTFGPTTLTSETQVRGRQGETWTISRRCMR